MTVTAILDNQPQAYTRLERAAEENAQQFATVRSEKVPEHVVGLGVDAWWFPTEGQVETTDGVRLITVNVAWPGAPPARRRALAEQVARPYLGPLKNPYAP